MFQSETSCAETLDRKRKLHPVFVHEKKISIGKTKSLLNSNLSGIPNKPHINIRPCHESRSSQVLERNIFLKNSSPMGGMSQSSLACRLSRYSEQNMDSGRARHPSWFQKVVLKSMPTDKTRVSKSRYVV